MVGAGRWAGGEAVGPAGVASPAPAAGAEGTCPRVAPAAARPGSISPARVPTGVSGGPSGPMPAAVVPGSDPPVPIVSRSRGSGSPMRAPSHAAGVDRDASRMANPIDPLYGTLP